MVKFRLGAVPVTIHLSFLILALFGWLRFEDPAYTIAWTVGVGLAILAHEAGHAFTARAFSTPNVAIMLCAFGGATTYPLTTRITPGRRFLISAAGSAVGIATGAALLAVGSNQGWFDIRLAFPPMRIAQLDPLTVLAFGFIEAALFWGILNWIPMRPLDGGQMVQSLLEMTFPAVAERATRAISLVVAIPIIIWGLVNGFIFLAMIVGFLLLSGLRTPPQPPPRPPAEPRDGEVLKPEVVEEPRPSAPPPPPRERRDPPSDFPI